MWDEGAPAEHGVLALWGGSVRARWTPQVCWTGRDRLGSRPCFPSCRGSSAPQSRPRSARCRWGSSPKPREFVSGGGGREVS